MIQKNSKGEYLWETRDHGEIPVQEMSDEHLKSTREMIKDDWDGKKWKAWRTILDRELAYRKSKGITVDHTDLGWKRPEDDPIVKVTLKLSKEIKDLQDQVKNLKKENKGLKKKLKKSPEEYLKNSTATHRDNPFERYLGKDFS
jgi:hypothetical protein